MSSVKYRLNFHLITVPLDLLRSPLASLKGAMEFVEGVEDKYMLGTHWSVLATSFDTFQSSLNTSSLEARMRLGPDLAIRYAFKYSSNEVSYEPILETHIQVAQAVNLQGYPEPNGIAKVDCAVVIRLNFDAELVDLAGVNSLLVTQLTCFPTTGAGTFIPRGFTPLPGFVVEYKLDYSLSVRNQMTMDLTSIACLYRFLGFGPDAIIYGAIVTPTKAYIWSAWVDDDKKITIFEPEVDWSPGPGIDGIIDITQFLGFVRFYITMCNIREHMKSRLSVKLTKDRLQQTYWRASYPDSSRKRRARTPSPGLRTPSDEGAGSGHSFNPRSTLAWRANVATHYEDDDMCLGEPVNL